VGGEDITHTYVCKRAILASRLRRVYDIYFILLRTLKSLSETQLKNIEGSRTVRARSIGRPERGTRLVKEEFSFFPSRSTRTSAVNRVRAQVTRRSSDSERERWRREASGDLSLFAVNPRCSPFGSFLSPHAGSAAVRFTRAVALRERAADGTGNKKPGRVITKACNGEIQVNPKTPDGAFLPRYENEQSTALPR
jgi:hypothetical protein